MFFWLMFCVFCSNRANKVEELEAVSQQLSQTNVVGNIHLFNIFLPLVLKGKVKKVVAISSGVADLDLINDLEIDTMPLYAASKASLNVIVAKFNAQYKRDGVLFLSISPGVVEVGRYVDSTLSTSLLLPFPVAIQGSQHVWEKF
jgi:NAD(P)-dependent dehydrogenase (short-subunit alcohol dehydrogenase family)